MKTGTKSLLFGGHQFIIHPIFVFIAWVKLYKALPDWKETICIVIHDWGYWGSPKMDDDYGEWHSFRSAKWFNTHRGWGKEYELIMFHSRFMARKCNKPVSKLCLPDKYGVALMPTWLWIWLCKASGELQEYMAETKYEINEPSGSRYRTPQEFFKAYKSICDKWIKTGNLTTATGIEVQQ